MTLTALLPKPLRRFLLRRQIRRYEKIRDGAYKTVRWMTEHHATWCNCATCQHRKAHEAGEFESSRAFEKELRELDMSV